MFTSPNKFKMPDEPIMAKPWILTKFPPPLQFQELNRINTLTFVTQI